MFLIANFKQNKNKEDYKDYVNKALAYFKETRLSPDLHVIFCPPYPYFNVFKDLSNLNNINLGAQDVSRFDGGSHTGEVSAYQLKDYCSYCIVGHSERRKGLNEDGYVINEKIARLKEQNIKPIVCISRKDQIVPGNVLTAYEPIENIGMGESMEVEKIESFYKELPEEDGIIYGGSVNYKNVRELSKPSFIKGFLVGTSSLKIKNFIKIIENLNE